MRISDWSSDVCSSDLSDVPGDQPADIASGPTVADATSCADALDIVRRYQIMLPNNVLRRLESSAGETVKPNDPRLSHVETHLIATPQMALTAAADVARQAGVEALILGDSLEGDRKSTRLNSSR